MEKHLMLTMLIGEAIQEYYLTEDKKAWVLKYKSLYEQCIYGPSGLPAIISSNADGINFPSIQEFVELYQISIN